MADGPLSSPTVPPAFIPVPSTPVDLRPLTTSELIDRGFSLYRAHFAGFLLLALLCQAAPLLSQIIIMAAKLNPQQNEMLDNPKLVLIKMGIITTISLVSQLIVYGFEIALTFYIADAYLGKVPSIRRSLRQWISRLGSGLWTCVLSLILIGLTFLFPFMALGAGYVYYLFYPPLQLTSLLFFWIAAFVLFIASIVPVLIVFMRLWVTVPAFALEGLSGWKAIKRSSQLVRYDPGLGILYWGEMRLSFLLLPLFVIELLVLSLTSLPVTLHHLGEVMRNGSSGQLAAPPDSTLIVTQILTFLAVSLILPLYSIATTLFYYDVRIRREGFDLEFMAENLGKHP